MDFGKRMNTNWVCSGQSWPIVIFWNPGLVMSDVLNFPKARNEDTSRNMKIKKNTKILYLNIDNQFKKISL